MSPRLKPTLANPTLAILIGRLWPNQFWPKLVFQSFEGSELWGPRRVGAQTQKKSGPEGWGVEGWGAEGWGPEGWGPESSRFSSLSHHRFALFVSLWVSSRGILVVFEAPEPSNVHVWSSGVVV